MKERTAHLIYMLALIVATTGASICGMTSTNGTFFAGIVIGMAICLTVDDAIKRDRN